MSEHIYDIVGIGFGPGNIAVAVALDEMGWRGSAHFLERAAGPQWQSGMLIDGADTQNHPLRDFVTPRNPRSRFGFLTYLHEHGRFFEYLNLGLHYPLRKDFAQYVQWVARHFDDQVSYSEEVVAVQPVHDRGRPCWRICTAGGRAVLARSLIFAPGRTPHVPAAFRPLGREHAVHLGSYLERIESFARAHPKGRVAVVGASQSAVEIVLDLLNRFEGLSVLNLVRGFGYQLKDTSPFSERAYFPGFVDDFYFSSEASKRRTQAELWRSNYGSADADVLNSLYLKLYEQRLGGRERLRLLTRSEVVSACHQDGAVRLGLREPLADGSSTLEVDLVVLATGFLNFGGGEQQERYPALLGAVAEHVHRAEDGCFVVGRDYRVSSSEALAPLYLNGLNESTHGFGDAGSFSLLSLRSWDIAQSVVTALQSGRREAPVGVPP